MLCPSCGHAAAPGAKFCSECGQPITSSSRAAPLDRQEEAERRLLHVMFCDLVDSTPLGERMDAEDYRELTRAYYGICADAVERYDGYVVKNVGDGVLTYFGYPSAFGDDARRAVLAALDITAAMPALRRRLASGREIVPMVRVGIHTGTTIVGEVGSGTTFEALAVGETPNLAARLQQFATPGEVVISDTTRHLVEQHFELQALGAFELKGISAPTHVHRVLGPLAAPAPVQLARDVFVGREGELDAISASFAGAVAGHQRFVAICAGPGMGKSRLVEAARRRIGDDSARWVCVGCSPFFRNTPHHPLVQLVQSAAGIASSDDGPHRLAKLEQLLADAGVDVPEAVALLGALVTGHEVPDELEYSAEVRSQRTKATLARLLRGLAGGAPAVVVIEDLHWADPSTIDVLCSMLLRPPPSPLLVLLTYRPELEGGPSGGGVVELRLGPLELRHVEMLVDRLAANVGLPAERLRDIARRADGVPLFVEELVKAVHDRPDAPGVERSDIPLTVQALLTARLDQLRRSKRVAQLGAMLGRRFPVDLLASLDHGATDLDRELAELVDAEILVPVREAETPSFEFRHVLIQEAAYDSLLRSDRRRLHGHIAAIYEERRPAEVDSHPEVVGYHWRQSGSNDRAAPYLKAAADRSKEAYAHEEALALYADTALAVAAVLAEGEGDPVWHELLVDVHERTGDILAVLQRASESEQAYRDALAHARDTVRAAGLHRRIGVVHEQDRPRALAAFEEAERTLGADHASRPVAWRHEWLAVHLACMQMHYWFDEHEAMASIERRIRPYVESGTPEQKAELFDQLTLMHFRRESFAMGDEALASAWSFLRAAEAAGDLLQIANARFTLGFTMLFSGRPEDAIVHLEAALELTRRSGQRTIEIRCITYLATAHRMAGRVEETRRFSLLCRDEASEYSMDHYVGAALGNLAWVALVEDDLDASHRLAAAALDKWRASTVAWAFYWVALLPAVAVAVARDDDELLVASAAKMLEPGQQRLPERVHSALVAVAAAAADGDPSRARAAAVDTLRAAAAHKLLTGWKERLVAADTRRWDSDVSSTRSLPGGTGEPLRGSA